MIYGAPAPEQESNTVTTAMMASGFAMEDTDVRITTPERRSRTPPWRGNTPLYSLAASRPAGPWRANTGAENGP
jgi:hypothetical protein